MASAWSLRRRMAGLTLIEILTVMAVLAIVTTIAAPGMRSFGISQRAKSLSFELVSDLLTARSEALKRNQTVVVAPLDGNWAAGWTVSAGVTRLATRQTAADSLRFDGAPTSISFNPFGRVAAPADPVRMSVLPADSASDAAKRCVELDPSGYAKTRLGACS